jgi:hypothetical protein
VAIYQYQVDTAMNEMKDTLISDDLKIIKNYERYFINRIDIKIDRYTRERVTEVGRDSRYVIII